MFKFIKGYHYFPSALSKDPLRCLNMCQRNENLSDIWKLDFPSFSCNIDHKSCGHTFSCRGKHIFPKIFPNQCEKNMQFMSSWLVLMNFFTNCLWAAVRMNFVTFARQTGWLDLWPNAYCGGIFSSREFCGIGGVGCRGDSGDKNWSRYLITTHPSLASVMEK